MPVVPFSIPAKAINAGINIFGTGPQGDQPFNVPSGFQQLLANLFAGGAWQHRTPENNVEYRVERLDDGGQWVVWGSGKTQEGIVGKGGAIGNITIYGTGRAETARIVVIADQAIAGGISASGTITS